MSHDATAQFNPLDPHGHHDHDHEGHIVVDWKILLGILMALLFFTLLTVSAANFEKWIAAEFDVVIPNWVNVMVAMSIATVKATLVCAFFMQLFYDKFLNTVIMLFCLLALGLFLGFSALDLGGRGRVNDFIAAPIVLGGNSETAGMQSVLGSVPNKKTNLLTQIEFAKQTYIEEHGQEAWDQHNAELEAKHGHHGSHPVSDANRSIPTHGITPDLYSTTEPNHDGHTSHDDPAHDEDDGH